jgi:HK97 family phage major capsid protein
MSRQLFDRGQPGMDLVVFSDLAADYDMRLDLQCLTGSGTGANAKGLFSDSNRIQVTFTTGSPTVQLLYPKIADAVQQIGTQRGLAPNVIVMHPRRWAWVNAAVDSTGRPFVEPVGGNGFNTVGASTGAFNTTTGGPVGQLFGLPVVLDANIPTNFGAGTNEDAIIVMYSPDVWLLEDQPVKTRIDESIGSANLNVVLQLWNYYAFSTERYSKATATIGGTGLVAPTF